MAHNNYYLDLCVETYITNGDALLLRWHDKYEYWGVPGGHIDAGEDAQEAALREAWEEVGLKVELIGPQGWVKTDTETHQDLVPPLFVYRHRINEVHEHAAFVFAAQSESRKLDPQVEREATECMWVTQQEIDAMNEEGKLQANVYRYACAILKLAK